MKTKIFERILAIITILCAAGFAYLVHIGNQPNVGMGGLGLVVPGLALMVIGVLSFIVLVLSTIVGQVRKNSQK